MSNIKDEILFSGSGLDTDRDFKFMDKGDAPYRLNILHAEDGSNGLITNLKGNRKVTYIPPENHPWLNANVYFVLSSCYDPLERVTYYWIFSQPVDTTGSGDYEYDNRLLRFDEDTEVIDTIFVDYKNCFGLDPAKPFKDSFVLGDWLFFNPQVSEPKMIHIQMAYNYTNYDVYDPALTYVYGQKVTYFGGLLLALVVVNAGETPVTNQVKWEKLDNAYQDETGLSFDSEFRYAFNEIKQPPVVRPKLAYGTDTSVASNNVRGMMFRFTYRYKYFDDSYSVCSAFSDVSLPIEDEKWNGEVIENTFLNNYISVVVNLHSAALVKEIEIYFQQINDNWRRCKIINRQEISLLEVQDNFVYKFYNNEAYEVFADPLFINKIYDSVPRRANSQEIINKNILCYGGCMEGFDNLDKNEIDVTLTPEINTLPTVEDVNVVLRDNIASGDLTEYNEFISYEEGIYYYQKLNIANYVAWGVGDGIVFKLTINGNQDIVVLQGIISIATLINAISTAVSGNFVWAEAHVSTNELWIGSQYGFPVITVCCFYTTVVTTSAIAKYRGFKTGAFHPFCQFYYDGNLRRWDAQTSKESVNTTGYSYDGTTVYIPTLGELSPTPSDTAYRWRVNWEVNHLAPIGAKYWRWGYGGNSLCSYFIQYIIKAISTANDIVSVDITPLQVITITTAGYNKFSNSNISSYSWVKGDRIRFITETNDPGTSIIPIGVCIEGTYDFEITGQSTDGKTIYLQDFNYVIPKIGENSLVEIYRPRKIDSEPVFYEFGDLMPVIEDINGNLVHGGITVNQDYGLNISAKGTFDCGDIYHLYRTPSKPLLTAVNEEAVYMESQWYSDFYDSNEWDRGKIGVETSFNERYLNLIRFSNQYLQRTEINGLSTFDGLNYKELNDVYGDILRIIEIGDTLKVYQRKKPSSILIGKTQYYDAEGNPNIQSISDRVLGSVTYSQTNYGTEFPESISRNNRYVYGFDVYNGVFWRDSANGIFPISGRYESADAGGDYKMETYFKQKAKDLLVSGIDHVDVLTVWDERHKNLYIIFKDYVTEDNDEAIMFHEPSNRWICFTDMGYTPVDGWNQILELNYWILSGFEGGIGFLFDEDTRFAVFDIEATGDITDFITGTVVVDEDGTTYVITEDSDYIIE